jgi:transcriptional regulator PpsR
VRQFRTPRKSIGDLDADVATKLIVAASDIALIIDRRGVIKDLACSGNELLTADLDGWIGRPWVDTVTVESKPKVFDLLREAGSDEAPRWRQINHSSTIGSDLPIRYSAFQLRPEGRIIALGRDLASMAVLQQQLMSAQQQMEREYSRLRQIETRYRALFQLSAEPVVIVETATLKIVDANPAALNQRRATRCRPGVRRSVRYRDRRCGSGALDLGAIDAARRRCAGPAGRRWA